MGQETNPYEVLVAPMEKQLIRTVARFIHDPDDAEDAMQEILKAVWEKREKIQRQPNPQAYIMRVCISKTYDMLRKRSRQRSREVGLDGDIVAGNPDHAAMLESREQAALIFKSIASLPEHQAHAVLLRLVDEKPFKEISAVLGCSEATTYSHYSKGIARLRQILNLPKRKEQDQ